MDDGLFGRAPDEKVGVGLSAPIHLLR